MKKKPDGCHRGQQLDGVRWARAGCQGRRLRPGPAHPSRQLAQLLQPRLRERKVYGIV